MVRRVLFVGGAALLLKLVYDEYITHTIPNGVLVTLPVLGTVMYDDVAFAAVLGAAIGPVSSMLRGGA